MDKRAGPSTVLTADELVLPSVAAIRPYEPGKPIEEVERELGVSSAAKLASNENPVGPSPLALEAIRHELASLNRYPDGGSYFLRNKVAARHGLSPQHIFLGSGSCEIINLLALLFLRPGLNALAADHSFVIYRLAAAAVGAALKSVALREDFSHDLEAMAAAIDAQTALVFLDNPDNPTGTFYRRGQWREFLKRVPQRVVIVADEAYFDFVRDPDYPDSLEDHDGARMLVTLRTFSKIFGLAGLRVGYAVARPDIVRLLDKVRQPFNLTSLAQAAALAGMDDREHVEKTLKVNREGIAFLERELRRLGLGFVPTQANFILVEVGDGRAVFERLMRRGVIVRPMDGYGFARHVRISVGLEEENRRLIEALSRVL